MAALMVQMGLLGRKLGVIDDYFTQIQYTVQYYA